MKTIEIEITGTTPLMHHRMTEEQLMGLLGAKQKKKKSEEVLLPRDIAESHSYKNKAGEYVIPTEYVGGALLHVSSDYKQDNSARKSLKGIIKGVVRPTEAYATLTDKKNKPLKNFEVDIKKATNHQKGAVAVCRPRFDEWKTTFCIEIDDSVVSPKIVHEMLSDSGKRAGIGSFRVAKSGFYGQFQVTRWKEIK